MWVFRSIKIKPKKKFFFGQDPHEIKALEKLITDERLEESRRRDPPPPVPKIAPMVVGGAGLELMASGWLEKRGEKGWKK